jgi:tetratricopeptide (TPR) repeat protein
MQSLRQAEQLLKDGEAKKAGFMASKALAKLKQDGSAADVVSALEVMTRAYCTTQDAVKALAILKDCRSEFQRKGDRHSEVLITSLQAEAHLATGSSDEALSRAEEALEMAVQDRDRLAEAAALRAKAKVCSFTGNSDETVTLSKTVAHILYECKDFEGQGLELLTVAETHFYLAQYSECIATAKQAAKIFREVGHTNAEANALRMGAEAAWAQGSLNQVSWRGKDEGALPMAREALELYKKTGMVDGQVETCGMIAQVLLQMEEFEQAQSAGLEALKKARESGNRVIQAESLKTIVNALLGRLTYRISTATQTSLKEIGDAAVEVASQLEVLWATADEASLCEASYVKANALLERARALHETKLDNAVASADLSVHCAKEAQLRKWEAAALCLKADIHFQMKDINPAADAVDEAFRIYKEDGDMEGLDAVKKLFAKFRSSYEWSKRKVKVTDGKDAGMVDTDYTAIPVGATGLDIARGYLHIHFDNLRGRAAKNIG